MPVHYPEEAGKPYRPSNGTEGMIFEASFCERCKHYDVCEIPLYAMCNSIGDKDYPEQWKYDENGRPTCTAFSEEQA